LRYQRIGYPEPAIREKTTLAGATGRIEITLREQSCEAVFAGNFAKPQKIIGAVRPLRPPTVKARP
jgi:hypothetical protein